MSMKTVVLLFVNRKSSEHDENSKETNGTACAESHDGGTGAKPSAFPLTGSEIRGGN
jgi:hypothetical protein